MLLSMAGSPYTSPEVPTIEPADGFIDINNLSLYDLPQQALHELLERFLMRNFVTEITTEDNASGELLVGDNVKGVPTAADTWSAAQDVHITSDDYDTPRHKFEEYLPTISEDGSPMSSSNLSTLVDDDDGLKDKGTSTFKSVGSKDHKDGSCTPCAFFCYSKMGCNRGQDCLFCHENHPKKRGRKQQRRVERQGQPCDALTGA